MWWPTIRGSTGSTTCHHSRMAAALTAQATSGHIRIRVSGGSQRVTATAARTGTIT